MIKNILSIAAVFCVSIGAYAQSTVPSKLESATIFNKGAELTHKAKVSLKSGTNEVTIEGLSSNVNMNSLTIKCSDNVTVMGSEYAYDFIAVKSQSETVKKLKDSIEIYGNELATLRIKLETANSMQTILTANMTSEKAGIDIANLMKMMDYYKTKSIEINTEKKSLNYIMLKARNRINVLNAQLGQEEGFSNRRVGKLNLRLAAPLAKTSDIEINYFTGTASWQPIYDIQATGPDKPLKIISKARFAQATGLDWSNVKITLSTATPSTGRTAPVLKAWFIGIDTPAAVMNADEAMQNRMSYAKKNTGSMAGVDLTSPDPIYIVDGTIVNASVANSIAPEMIESKQWLDSTQVEKQYGKIAESGATVITTRKNFITAGETASADATYTIDLPYDLLTNGSEHTVNLRTIEVPATFEYYGAPHIDKTVYLLASIKEWAQYGLIGGEANITYDGTYAGKTIIDPYSTGETLHLTLGQDKSVVVKREKMQDYSKTRFVGNEKRQSLTYKLTVKNNKSIPVNMILKEQYPISTHSTIIVELDKTSGAHNNTEIGTLTWEFKLDAGETKTFEVGYTVRSPKNYVLQ